MPSYYLKHLCGDGTEDVLWDTGITNSSSLPDLPRCFQNTVLVWIPNFFLFVCCSIWIPVLISRPQIVKWKCSRFNNTKLVLAILQALMCLTALSYSLADRSNFKLDITLKYSMQLLALIFIMVLIKLELVKGVKSSGVLSITWLLFVVSYAVEFRSRIIRRYDRVDGPFHPNTVFFVSYTLTCMQFFLCFYPDLHSLHLKRPCRIIQQAEGSYFSIFIEPIVENKRCPEEKACFFSRLTFFWTGRLIWDACKRSINFKDLWLLSASQKCINIVPPMDEQWHKQLKAARAHAVTKLAAAEKSDPRFRQMKRENRIDDDDSFDTRESKRAKVQKETDDFKQRILESHTSVLALMMRVAGQYYIYGGLLKLVYEMTAFLLPLLLHLLIEFVETPDSWAWLGLFYVTLLFILFVFRTIILQNYWSVSYVVGLKLRTAFMGVVYRKATKLSAAARQSTTMGEMTNLMSVDAQKFQESPAFFHNLWSTPLTIGVSIYMLWQILGVSVLAGLTCLVFMVPLNIFFVIFSKSLQDKQMRYKDTRVRKLNEVLNGMKVLKLYSWEEYFSRDLERTRKRELGLLRRAQLLNCISAVSWFMTPYLVALTTFAAFILSSSQNVLDAKTAFVSLSIFNIISYPLSILPMVMVQLSQAFVSLRRLKRFLLQDELQSYVQYDENLENAFEVNNASFSWSDDSKEHLININLKVAEKELVGVVGWVGAGKSSLLSAISGELNKSKGEVKVKGTIAYVSQQAWIQQKSFRDNILFSKPYNKARYDQVLHACCLLPDLDGMPFGDVTEIGEKGINLSGGQKQRVSLARALYQDADIYLFDDPLSAVDTHVGNDIFNMVISNNGLLKEKTRVLVTNNPAYLPTTDRIVVMKEGEISEMGPYEELMKQGAFATFIKTYASEHPRHSSADYTVLSPAATTMSSVDSKDLNEGKIIKPEALKHGNVKFSVFLRYLKACGVLPGVILFVAYSTFIAGQVGSSLWLSEWSNDGESNNDQKLYRLQMYSLMGLSQIASVICISFSLAFACTVASKNLHQMLLHSITRAPMSFFDTTPLGRIISRFAGDIDTIDTMLPISIRIWLASFSGVFAIFFIISYSTPFFIIAAVPLIILYAAIQRVFIRTSRQLRRLESNLKAPIYNHFSETITGLGLLRAAGEIERFVGVNDSLVDSNQMGAYTLIAANRWLGVYLEFLGTLVVFFAGLFAVIKRDSLDPGVAGLSLSYALQVTAVMNMFWRMTSEIEVQVVSVERVHDFINCPQEAPAHIEETTPPDLWPRQGVVDIKNLSVRYREDTELVLNNVTCYINAAERIGVVGRTGAGKSSFILALFRILEASRGKIIVDRLDISTLGLHEFRSRFTVIPQDPVLFAGTLRMNLDPSKTCSDQDIWNSLQQSNLQEFVQSLPDKLETSCAEGGENFSLGQRQLICLARALLRKSKLLLFDEATAAVDLRTDAIVQSTIKTEFANCTIITIAHRLSTIIDYDKILVLENGQVKEFDTPTKLLSDKSSIFYSMAKIAGLAK